MLLVTYLLFPRVLRYPSSRLNQLLIYCFFFIFSNPVVVLSADYFMSAETACEWWTTRPRA